MYKYICIYTCCSFHKRFLGLALSANKNQSELWAGHLRTHFFVFPFPTGTGCLTSLLLFLIGVCPPGRGGFHVILLSGFTSNKNK